MIDYANNLELFTDQYELTMAAGYFEESMFEPATFSLFIREYPQNRGYFVAAGLEDVLAFLENFSFSTENIDYLRGLGIFQDKFLEYLANIRFTGSVRAMPEGTVFFKDEPVLEVTGPIIEAQLAETFIINAVNFPVLATLKASRCAHAAKGANLIDFSMRRTQGLDAAIKIARSSLMGGFKGTSNALAAKYLGVSPVGTMAHSFVTSFREEIDAFRAFARAFPDNTVLLVDTYDTINGTEKAIQVAKEMEKDGHKLRGIRLDSGDMVQLSKDTRKMLDQAGLDYVQIMASGGFDEFKIQRYFENGALIDGFGVGTKLGVSADAAYLDIAYKLVQYASRPVLKLSSGKKTLVGQKQVFRETSEEGMIRDTIALKDENLPGAPLLQTVMEKGKRTIQSPSPDELGARVREQLAELGEEYKDLHNPREMAVELGPGLRELQEEVIHRVVEKELGES
jgi:nicotinate phosphoribosyltransferase